jgi:hypothetical protein
MSLLNKTLLAVTIMHDSITRQLLAISIIPNFPQTGIKFFLIILTVFSNSLAESVKTNSLINAPIILLDIYNLNFNDNHHSNHMLFTMVLESETTSPFTPIIRDDLEGEVLFHDTVQRDSNANSVTSPVASVDHHSLSSELVPTTLVHSYLFHHLFQFHLQWQQSLLEVLPLLLKLLSKFELQPELSTPKQFEKPMMMTRKEN